MNLRDRGTHSEFIVSSRLMELGYAVSIPTTEERYDLVVDVGNEFVSVQVKRMRRDERNAIIFDCKSSYNGITGGETYTSDEIDGFVAHNPENDNLYWVDVDEAPNTAMSLRESEYDGQSHNVNWATDYELETNFVGQFGLHNT